MKILTELITQEYLADVPNFDVDNQLHRKPFHEGQAKFTAEFDYFVGTCTGGLLAFCLAVNYNILELMDIYSDAFGPWICSKYDPSVIHKKIDDIIRTILFPSSRKITAEDVTLLDIRNLLNPGRFISEEQ